MASRLADEFLLDGHAESRTLGQVEIASFIQREWIFENRERMGVMVWVFESHFRSFLLRLIEAFG
jgi:hypothetical protein